MINALHKRGDNIHNTATASPRKATRCIALIFALALLLSISASILPLDSVTAQELTYPNPLKPDNNATEISVTSIVFSWQPFYVGTNKYAFELSKNFDMSDPELKTEIAGTTYRYPGTLDYNASYYWRVMASDPIGGSWSPQFRFTTKAEAPAATPAIP